MQCLYCYSEIDSILGVGRCLYCNVLFAFEFTFNKSSAAEELNYVKFFSRFKNSVIVLTLCEKTKTARIDEIPDKVNDTVIFVGEIPYIDYINPANAESIIKSLLLLL